MRKSVFWGILAIALSFNSTTHAQPELDTTLAGTGKAVIGSTALITISDIAIQADNRIIMTAPCMDFNILGVPFCSFRVTAGGGLDNTFKGGNPFSSAGVYTKFPGTTAGGASGVAVQHDGKVVVVGYATSTTEKAVVVRYLADGSLDSTFGTGGIVFSDLTPGASARAQKVAIQADGKIVVVGFTGDVLFTARYLANGSLDDSYGTGGVAKLSPSLDISVGMTIAIQSDGKILAGGRAGSSFLIARFNTDGTLDNGWDADGVRTMTGQSFSKLSVAPDGYVVALGTDDLIYKFNNDGSTATGFDGDGVRPAFTSSSKAAHSLTTTADGKITVVGTTRMASCPFNPCPQPNFLYNTARYNADGSPDASYSDDGYLDIDVGGPHADGARAVTVDNAGRVVIGGVSSSCCVRTIWEQPQSSIARLLGPLVHPANYTITGRVLTAEGLPAFRVTVRMIDNSTGESVTALTNPFGYYVFNVIGGRTYSLAVKSRELDTAERYAFIGGNVTNFDFTSQPPVLESGRKIAFR